jgi:Lysozyme like domain
MTTYTYAQLEGLWINAGGPKAVAPLAAAIAEAESRGNSAATNPTDNGGRQTSWGLWQISNGTHQQPVPNILSPTVNAQQAVLKYKGAGDQFTPWGTFQTGAYKAFLSPGTTAQTTGLPSAGAVVGTSSTTSTTEANCLFGLPPIDLGVTSTPEICVLSKSEARGVIGVGLTVAGIFITAIGVVLLAAYGLKGTGAGKAAMSAAVLLPGVGEAAAVTAATARPRTRRPARTRSAPQKTKASQTTAS